MFEIHELEYVMWQLGDYANQETCQIHHTARIKFQFEFAFISRADYWNKE